MVSRHQSCTLASILDEFKGEAQESTEDGDVEEAISELDANALTPPSTAKQDPSPSKDIVVPTNILDASRHGRVLLPLAGTTRAGDDDNKTAATGGGRQASCTCAICLSAIGVGDQLSWASNPACPHLFHHKCIKDWLVASGRKHLAQQRRRHATQEDVVEHGVTDFPMSCPCCRQPFILSKVATASATETNSSRSSQAEEVASDTNESPANEVLVESVVNAV